MIRAVFAALLLPSLALAQAVPTETVPKEIVIGTLHASSGTYAAISTPVFDGLGIWVEQVNAKGGVYVKPFDRKLPVRLVAYDDQSSPATAATLYNQLITQDKVDILTADSGSVLTSPAVPIAREHKMFLFDQTGTGAPFFSKDNPYIALVSSPASLYWPQYLAAFLTREAPKAGIRKLAILYSTNDFTATQASTLREMIRRSGAPVEIVFDQGIPTTTSNYTVLISNIAQTNPDAVLELGYPNNDIAFLRAVQDGGQKFRMLFTLYAGLEAEEVARAVGARGMEQVFTYVPPANLDYKPDLGLSMPAYRALWEQHYPNGSVGFGVNAVAGYATGILIERVLAATASLGQLDLRAALFALSGKVRTLVGPFALDPNGAQMGEIMPVGQLLADGKGGVRLAPVYPPDVATAAAAFAASP